MEYSAFSTTSNKLNNKKWMLNIYKNMVFFFFSNKFLAKIALQG